MGLTTSANEVGDPVGNAELSAVGSLDGESLEESKGAFTGL